MLSEYETADAPFHIDVAVMKLARNMASEPGRSLEPSGVRQPIMIILGGSPQRFKGSPGSKAVMNGGGSGGSGGLALEVDGPQHFMSNDPGEEGDYDPHPYQPLSHTRNHVIAHPYEPPPHPSFKTPFFLFHCFCMCHLLVLVPANKMHLPMDAEGQYRPTGETSLRRRLLGARGWRVVSLPVQEWRRLKEEGEGACRTHLAGLLLTIEDGTGA